MTEVPKLHINWNTLTADSNGYKFLKMVMDCYLEQHVCIPTRGNNILDLILTNEMPIKDGIHMLSPVDNSDHNVILIFSTDCSISQQKEKRHLCNNQADYKSMCKFVKLRLSHTDLSEMSASAVWCNLNEVIQEAIRRFVPHRNVTNKSRNPLWMTGKVLRNVQKKQKLWKKMKGEFR